jgi:hypothetical protein
MGSSIGSSSVSVFLQSGQGYDWLEPISTKIRPVL